MESLGYIGDEILSSYVGIISQAIIRIPMNQPGFNGKYPERCNMEPENISME